MPRMGGKEVFAELKMVNPDVKVIIVSGYSIEGEAQQLLHRGALDFVQKPFRIGVLSQKIAAILNT
jgi:DNA-binding NtrC family response regulator